MASPSLALLLERRMEMAKNTKPDMSCARVKQYQSSDIGSCERHNERMNESYDNINVVPERIDMNVHYKSPDGKS